MDKVLRLGSPDSAPTMVRFVLVGLESSEEDVKKSPAGTTGPMVIAKV